MKDILLKIEGLRTNIENKEILRGLYLATCEFHRGTNHRCDTYKLI